MKLKIKVTKEILEASKNCGVGPNPFKGQSCAIALAVRDVFPLASIGGSQWWPFYKSRDESGRHYELPYNAKVFIVRFDNAAPHDRPMLPEIEFELEIEDEVIDLINIDEIKTLLENHPNLELIATN